MVVKVMYIKLIYYKKGTNLKKSVFHLSFDVTK